MNENALHVMGIPLLAHPKHTYSKIGGLTDSDSGYSSNSENDLVDLIQYHKEVESNSTKNSKSDQDSLPNLVIYATPQGRIVHRKETLGNVYFAECKRENTRQRPCLRVMLFC